MQSRVISVLFFAIWLIALIAGDIWLIWQPYHYWHMDRAVGYWLLLFDGLLSGMAILLGVIFYMEYKQGR